MRFFIAACAAFFAGSALAQSCDPISTKSHPDGLTYAAFNCFTDAVKFGNLYGSSDERDFLRIRKNGGAWGNNITALKAGDRISLVLYIHNSGSEGKFPATNTVARVDWSEGSTIVATIQADNTRPRLVADSVSLEISDGLRLAPIKVEAANTSSSYAKDIPAQKQWHDLKWGSFKSSFPFVNIFEFQFVVLND